MQEQKQQSQQVPNINRKAGEQQRLLSNLFLIGIITAVDYAAGTVEVTIGPTDNKVRVTAYLGSRRAGDDIEWWAPELEEQVLVFSPNGDLRRAVVLFSLPYQFGETDFTVPEDKREIQIEGSHGTTHGIFYGDGSSFMYHKGLHQLVWEIKPDKEADPEITLDLMAEAQDAGIINVTVGKDDLAKVTLKVDAGTGTLVITAGEAMITMDNPAGSITFEDGVGFIKLDGSGAINMSDGTSTIDMDGAGAINIKGALTVEGTLDVK